ncbi:hypothetical protein [Natrarchaeobaculum sulfurireducens]|uniref:Uncharacterized protein n=1 Tax=Natrarchaeobaculum sulfurireducens TaxID=2044521 RepID=A0A346PCV0_9EURY|nr:hypothetical protein [Natrarchaeobaculum sulfurireducens]AXR77345.1 hypothetical protein AArc1_1004 [Natrarchaeobaculum sulfurireducens]AXR82692.1 hypothetical protein AArcMg_2702 [Natrarchaeobaculum sulfurireducens]
MTELTIPPDADDDRTEALVREHVDVGDGVEVREAERTGGDDPAVTGEVTGIEAGHLEFDDQPLGGKSVWFDESRR